MGTSFIVYAFVHLAHKCLVKSALLSFPWSYSQTFNKPTHRYKCLWWWEKKSPESVDDLLNNLFQCLSCVPGNHIITSLNKRLIKISYDSIHPGINYPRKWLTGLSIYTALFFNLITLPFQCNVCYYTLTESVIRMSTIVSLTLTILVLTVHFTKQSYCQSIQGKWCEWKVFDFYSQCFHQCLMEAKVPFILFHPGHKG